VKSGKKSNRTLHLKTGHSPNYNATFHHEFTYVHFPLKCAYYFNAYLNEFSVNCEIMFKLDVFVVIENTTGL